MSYEILYKKYNVECGDYIMPLICTGSNNCYEVQWNGRERRERFWGINSFYGVDDKKILYTKNEIALADSKMKQELIDDVRTHMKEDERKTDAEIESEDSQWWLGFRTTNRSTIKQLCGALNRTKKTIPFETFIKKNGRFRIRLYHWATYPDIDTLFETWIETEDDLLEANRKYVELDNPCMDISFIRENLSFVDSKGDYVIMNGNNSYFERKRNNRTYWTYYAARHFVSRDKAEKYIRDNLSHVSGAIVKHIDELDDRKEHGND